MLRFLQRTLLYQRTSEAMHAYRVLKRAEHRSALKLKRAAVRARVLSEVQKAQIERVRSAHTGASFGDLRRGAVCATEITDFCDVWLATIDGAQDANGES